MWLILKCKAKLYSLEESIGYLYDFNMNGFLKYMKYLSIREGQYENKKYNWERDLLHKHRFRTQCEELLKIRT